MAKGLSLITICLITLLKATIATAQETPRNCPDPSKSEAALSAIGLGDNKNAIYMPLQYQQALAVFLDSREHRNWCQDVYPRSNNVRITGPLIGDKAYTTHARVRVYYSEEIVSWLDSDRQGAITDGAMIVKEMYPAPTDIEEDVDKPTGWAVMYRDSKKSHDGWFWFLYYLPQNVTTSGVPFEFGQYGDSFCLSCHASTDNSMGTFAFKGNLEDRDVASYIQTEPVFQPDLSAKSTVTPLSPHENFALSAGEMSRILYRPTIEPRSVRNSELLTLVRQQVSSAIPVPIQDELTPMPKDIFFDHIGAKPGDQDEPFMTSYQCQGCHDASYMVNTVTPNMAFELQNKYLYLENYAPAYFDVLNLSPYAEWQGSMMAMSGRDPIFRAQLEYELTTLETAEDKESVSQFCLSCHSVMGERTSPNLARSPQNVYASLGPNNPTPTPAAHAAAKFGALARDGVSCTTCHHITDENLGTYESFSAKFKTGDPSQIYGPFSDVKTLPMRQALGLTPVRGNAITDSGLCGSCHAIEVPVYKGQEKIGHTWEQTTYMEWANSDFAKADSDEAQTCQECHMPNLSPIDGKPITTKIANIEDATFPYAPNRADSADLELKERDSYRRHLLVGMNVFGMSMFQQFPALLGSATFNPVDQLNAVPSKLNSINELLDQAENRTAKIALTDMKIGKDMFEIAVNVENLAGHKLPSGVGFRRAFVELSVVDAKGDSVWCSGCTDEIGVLIDNNGDRLATEFATRYEDSQPDYAVIDNPTQVQIYEHRHVNSSNELTTSFIHLVEPVKDNRLLPKGWSKRGPYVKETEPHGLNSPLQTGEDDVIYRIPTSILPDDLAESGWTVKASLNYQSIPPYYLIDRFRILADEKQRSSYTETQKLLYLVLNLNTESSALGMQNWKVGLACTQQALSAGARSTSPASNCLPQREFFTAIPPGSGP